MPKHFSYSQAPKVLKYMFLNIAVKGITLLLAIFLKFFFALVEYVGQHVCIGDVSESVGAKGGVQGLDAREGIYSTNSRVLSFRGTH